LKLRGKNVIWPANLDSTKSRKHGRKLAKSYAVQTPRLDEMNDAAKRLSLAVEVVPGKSKPSVWWEKGGYLIVPKNDTKTVILRGLATEVRKIRAARTSQERK
jgi:signal recognition particle subunit SRP19